MKDILSLVLLVLLVTTLAACQPQGEDDVVSDNTDSSFTLNGAGE